jgi:TetR/AcrR family transcriptional regulator, transcriptional repressor for nem operon
MVGMDTKTALLDSAESAIRARGYDGFSYADLAAAVGIRKASIHHHFPAKADLARALIERYTANAFANLDKLSATPLSGGAQLAAFVKTYRQALEGGNKLCLCVAFCTGRDSLSPQVLAALNLFHETVTAWLGEVFALGKADGSITGVTDPEMEAQACLAQMEGAQLIARAAKDSGRFDAAVARLLARITPP